MFENVSYPRYYLGDSLVGSSLLPALLILLLWHSPSKAKREQVGVSSSSCIVLAHIDIVLMSKYNVENPVWLLLLLLLFDRTI